RRAPTRHPVPAGARARAHYHRIPHPADRQKCLHTHHTRSPAHSHARRSHALGHLSGHRQSRALHRDLHHGILARVPPCPRAHDRRGPHRPRPRTQLSPGNRRTSRLPHDLFARNRTGRRKTVSVCIGVHPVHQSSTTSVSFGSRPCISIST